MAVASSLLKSVSVLLIIVTCHGAAESWVCSPTTDRYVTTMMKDDDMENRITTLENQVRQLQKLLQEKTYNSYTTIEGFPTDCEEIYSNGTRKDGMYAISPDGRCPFFVFCDMKNGGWTVIQRRVSGGTSFYRNWEDYVTGFGDIEGSHWIGLEKIHRLTKSGTQIYFDLQNYDDSHDFAHYKVFTVHEAVTGYKMNVDPFGYDGTLGELFSYHDNNKFSTYDRDNDKSSSNCCKDSLDGGGWWYNSCYRLGNLNGVYGKLETGGIGYWTNKNIPIKNVTIKVKKINGVC